MLAILDPHPSPLSGWCEKGLKVRRLNFRNGTDQLALKSGHAYRQYRLLIRMNVSIVGDRVLSCRPFGYSKRRPCAKRAKWASTQSFASSAAVSGIEASEEDIHPAYKKYRYKICQACAEDVAHRRDKPANQRSAF